MRVFKARLVGHYFAVLVIFAGCLSLHARESDHKERYESPDKQCLAIVISKPFRQDAGNESYVEVHLKGRKKLVLRRDYSSDDGSHGYGVMRAAWTPDSMFFVYSLDNSGGHSPWHTPVEFYDRRQNKILSLDDALDDGVTSPEFSISAPDKVTVFLWFSKKMLTVSLSSIAKDASPSATVATHK